MSTAITALLALNKSVWRTDNLHSKGIIATDNFCASCLLLTRWNELFLFCSTHNSLEEKPCTLSTGQVAAIQALMKSYENTSMCSYNVSFDYLLSLEV